MTAKRKRKETPEQRQARSERAARGWEKRHAREAAVKAALPPPPESRPLHVVPDENSPRALPPIPPPPPMRNMSEGEKSRVMQADPATAQNEVRIINFVDEGGFTALGKVWYRGEELRVEVGSENWELTVNPATGRSWLDYNDEEQIRHYGRVIFQEGPWTGAPPPTQEEYIEWLTKQKVKTIDG